MKLQFDSNLPGLLDEVLSNQTCAILYQPINITKGILAELAQLATEIDDDRLHVLMLRLGLYDVPANKRVERIKELREQIASGCGRKREYDVSHRITFKNGKDNGWTRDCTKVSAENAMFHIGFQKKYLMPGRKIDFQIKSREVSAWNDCEMDDLIADCESKNTEGVK